MAAHSPRQGLALLQWDSELYAASALIVQSTSLLSNDATLAESLYGLRRMPIAPAADSKSAKRLAPWQRLLSVLVVVRIPAPYCLSAVAVAGSLLTSAHAPDLHHVRRHSGHTARSASSAIRHSQTLCQSDRRLQARSFTMMALAAAQRVPMHTASGTACARS